jgi:hypothetical protein
MLKGVLFEDEEQIATTYVPDAPRKVVSKNKAEQKRMMKKEEAAAILAAVGGVPAPGEFCDIISNGQSNAGGFYEVLRDRWGKVKHLALATWIINRHYVDMIFDDLESGKLESITFILSNRMSQLTHHTAVFNRLKTLAADNNKIDLRVCNSHAKVYALTDGNDFITISGSGNWSDNPRIENYVISNDRSRYEFHAAWMREQAKAK